MNYTPTERFTLYFDATNLLGEPIKTFRTYADDGAAFPRARKYLERTFALGVRVRY